MSATLRLRTPEGIEFALPLAGPVARMVAWLVDAACVLAGAFLLMSAVSAVSAVSPDVAQAIFVLGFYLFSVGYAIATEWMWRGQTVGKRLIGLRVVDDRGLRLQPWQVVARNLLRFVDSLPLLYLVGGLAVMTSARRQRLGDRVAGTVVIRARPARLPDVDQVLALKYNSLRRYPHLAARLRQRLGPDEALLGLRALLRRDELLPEARVAIFRDLARHYRDVVRFPDEAVEGLADEQYVRNVVDAVLRAG